MKTMKFTFWKDGDYYLGFWNDYPDCQTQGMFRRAGGRSGRAGGGRRSG